MKITSIVFKNPFFKSGYTNDIKIKNLNDINIFIGKNNSGKTTILDTLHNLLDRTNQNNKSISELSIKVDYSELKELLKKSIKNCKYPKNRAETKVWITTLDDDRIEFINDFYEKLENKDLILFLNEILIELKYKRDLDKKTIKLTFNFPNIEDSEIIISLKETLKKLQFYLNDLVENAFDYVISYYKKIYICALRRLEPSKNHISEDLTSIHTTVKSLFESRISSAILSDSSYKFELFEIPNFSLILDFIKKNELKGELKDILQPVFLDKFFRNLKGFFPDFEISIEFSRSPPQSRQRITEYGKKIGGWHKLGHGHQQLISLLFLLMLPNNYIYFIDEPDIGLHAGLQAKLIYYIKEKILKNSEFSKQFFFATHSTCFINFKSRCSHYICKKDRTNFSVELIDKEDLDIIRDELGYTPSSLLQATGVIWVEGPSDVFYIKMLFKCFNIDLDNEEMIIVPYFGIGNIVEHHLSIERMKKINQNFFVTMDSDKKHEKDQPNQSILNIKKEFEEAGYTFWLIDKYCDIEGFIPQITLNEFFIINTKIDDGYEKSQYEKLEDYIKRMKKEGYIDVNNPNYGKTSDAPKISKLILENQEYIDIIKKNSYLKEWINKLYHKICLWRDLPNKILFGIEGIDEDQPSNLQQKLNDLIVSWSYSDYSDKNKTKNILEEINILGNSAIELLKKLYLEGNEIYRPEVDEILQKLDPIWLENTDNDFYTPSKTANYMIQKLGEIKSDDRILDPCVGNGVFVKELLNIGIIPEQITTFDIEPRFKEKIEKLQVNFQIKDTLLDFDSHSYSEFDFILLNPPLFYDNSEYIRKLRERNITIYKEINFYGTHSLFIANCTWRLKEGGKLAIITEDDILENILHENLRNFILDNYKIDEILLAPKELFRNQGKEISPVIMILTKCSGEENITERENNIVKYISRINSEDDYKNPKKIQNINQKDYYSTQENKFVKKSDI